MTLPDTAPPDGERRAHPEPVPVEIAAAAIPIPVVVTGPPLVEAKPGVQHQASDPSKPATTTFQEDLTSAGQRTINRMWEGTQRNIAMAVTTIVLLVSSYLVVAPTIPTEMRLVAYATLSNVFFAVTSVYFTRTNHTKIGGVGSNEVGR